MDEKEWVQCDRCTKWRGLKREDFKAIVESETWYCYQNPDKQHSSCDVPQEMTDSEIDAIYRKRELKAKVKNVLYPVIWQGINSNVYTYKRRKLLKEDDIAICQCQTIDGEGCLENCINRILNIECTPGFCPCGNACRNQRFLHRHHAAVEIRPAGEKGFGLFSKCNIDEGEFVTEYMGEILDELEYLRRRTFYAETGHKHYYFMQIGNGEVIDACRMGNAGRFMNHSCDPNCETQKWLVKGDLKVGFFTTRSVQSGEELTFNYNFQTQEPIRCFCGSSKCTGTIGGGPKTPQGENGHPTEEMSELSKDSMEMPAPIMLKEEDLDEILKSFLAQQVGVFTENTYSHDQIKCRLKELYRSRGYSKLADSLETEDLSKVQRTPKSLSEAQGSTSSGDLSEKQGRMKDPGSRPLSRKRGRGRGKTLSQSSPLDKNSGGTLSPTRNRSRRVYAKQTVLSQKHRNELMRRRSEVDLSLDDITAESGKLYNPSRKNIVKVLRLFNLIKIGKNEKEKQEAEQVKEKEEKLREELERSRKIPITAASTSGRQQSPPITIAGYSIYSSQKEDPPFARQRAHFADLSLLLDVVLNTVDPVARTLFIKCGLLSQLQQVIGRNFAPQYNVLLRKILRVVDCLPLRSSDFDKTRSSHGTMADLIIALTHHKDNGVRNMALAIARQHCLISEFQSNQSSFYSNYSYGVDRRSGFSSQGGSYRSRPNNRRSQQDTGFTKRMNYASYGEENGIYGTTSSNQTQQPPPPPPCPPREKSQEENLGSLGSETSGGSVSLPPGFGATTRPHSTNKERENERNNSRGTQFSKTSDTQTKKQLRRDLNSRFEQDRKKILESRIMKKVHTCGQPGQQEGLFSNELGKTLELSKTTYEDNLEKESNDLEEVKVKRQKLTHEKEENEDKISGNELEGWDHLDQDFKEFVSQTLRRRIQKYQQPEHPLRLRYDEAEALFKKLYNSIICSEEDAFGMFARDKVRRHVSKTKLELNIKEFTRRTMHQFYDTRTLL